MRASYTLWKTSLIQPSRFFPKSPSLHAAGETDGGTTSSIAPAAARALPLAGTGARPLPKTSMAAALAQQNEPRASLGMVACQQGEGVWAAQLAGREPWGLSHEVAPQVGVGRAGRQPRADSPGQTVQGR